MNKIKCILNSLEEKITGNTYYFKTICKNFFGVNEESVINDQIQKNKKYLKYFIIIFLSLIIALVVKEAIYNPPYSFNEDGTISQIAREKKNDNESFDLNISTEESNKDVTINFYKENDESLDKAEEKTLDDYIEETISKIEEDKGDIISLPSQLENGERIWWNPKENKNLFMVVLIGFVIFFLMYKSKDSFVKKEKKRMTNLVNRDLPRIVNKILLIWKSGRTFDESVESSIQNLVAKDKKDYFVINLKQLQSKKAESGENLIFLINNFAVNTEIKDFVRITNVMLENQYKGSFLLDKLQMEREILWMNRKKTALEEGKKAETKLVIPMAILLIALIVVTAAPAFIQM